VLVEDGLGILACSLKSLACRPAAGQGARLLAASGREHAFAYQGGDGALYVGPLLTSNRWGDAYLRRAAISPEQSLLAFTVWRGASRSAGTDAGHGHGFELWRFMPGASLATITSRNGPSFEAVAFSEDGRMLAVAEAFYRPRWGRVTVFDVIQR
jgi:hypothetical protein